MEPGGQAGGCQRAGDLLHLTHEAPRLARGAGHRALRALGQIGLRDRPLAEQRLVGDLDGRRDDLIISGGVNVYPLEVENALRELPGVEDVAVYARQPFTANELDILDLPVELDLDDADVNYDEIYGKRR